jgi:uncharacterized protein HemX
MNLRKLTRQSEEEAPQEPEKKEAEKPKRTRIKKEEKQKSPLSGALALTVLAGIGILFFFSTFTNSDPQVKGVQTEKEKIQTTKQASEAASTIRGRLEDRLESIKERVSELDPEDAVENAPQINKLIEDLQALQNTPSEGIENACHAVCDSIDQRE